MNEVAEAPVVTPEELQQPVTAVVQVVFIGPDIIRLGLWQAGDGPDRALIKRAISFLRDALREEDQKGSQQVGE